MKETIFIPRPTWLRFVVSGQNAVITCSALKQVYRDHLAKGNDAVVLVYLKGEYGLIKSRLEDRQDHSVKADLLDSQFRTLEEPYRVITLEVTPDPKVVADAVKIWLWAFDLRPVFKQRPVPSAGPISGVKCKFVRA